MWTSSGRQEPSTRECPLGDYGVRRVASRDIRAERSYWSGPRSKGRAHGQRTASHVRTATRAIRRCHSSAPCAARLIAVTLAAHEPTTSCDGCSSGEQIASLRLAKLAVVNSRGSRRQRRGTAYVRGLCSARVPHPCDRVYALNVYEWYERLAEAFGRVAAFAAFGGVVGVVAASVTRDRRPDLSIAYGEWAAYAGALFGVFSICIEVTRAI